jgi:LVIVD repeat
MPYADGNRAYLAYWGVGMVILDISDVTSPRYVSTLRTHPPFGGGSGGASVHTIVPFAGRKLAVISTEGERPFVLDPNSDEGIPGLSGRDQPMNIVGIASLANETTPVLVSICPKPLPPPGSIWGDDYSTLHGTRYPFGNHNLHEPHGLPVYEQRSDRIYCSYFQAGLRVFDIRDSYGAVEIAAFVPPDPGEWNWQRNGGFPRPSYDLCRGHHRRSSRGHLHDQLTSWAPHPASHRLTLPRVIPGSSRRGQLN